jgi:uncharacterized membrane protein YfcA
VLTVYLPLADIELFWPGAILLGALVGFLTGLFGVGGGFLLTPALKVLLHVPYDVAIGTDLAQILITGGFSAFRHYVRGSVDIKLGVLLGLAAAAGANVGKIVNTSLKSGTGFVLIAEQPQPVYDIVMNALFLTLLVAVGVAIWRDTARTTSMSETATSNGFSRWLRSVPVPPRLAFPRSGIAAMSIWAPAGLSLGVGVLSGLMGVGGGFVSFPLLVYGIGVPTALAAGTSALQIVFATGLGAILYFLSGQVELILLALLLTGSLLGVQAGVAISARLGGRQARRYFVLVLALGAAVILFDFVRMAMGTSPAGE